MKDFILIQKCIFIRRGILTILALDRRLFAARFALCNDVEKGGPVLNNNNKRVLKLWPVISLQTLYIPVKVNETQFKLRGIPE